MTTIVRSLRNFARLDQAELKEADLHEGIDDSLMLIHHDIKSRVEVERNYGQIPPVTCYPGRLNQVFLNVLNNAQQAIDGTGRITITTALQDEAVLITIADTGSGTPEEDVSKVFDPGFTTKGWASGPAWACRSVSRSRKTTAARFRSRASRAWDLPLP